MAEFKAILSAKRADILDRYRHPWIFSKGLAGKPDAPLGALVRVVSQQGKVYGWAFYHPHNPIALRMIHFEKDPPDETFWRTNIAAAQARRRLGGVTGDHYRLIHGENDGFPGLTVDRYGSLLVMQVNSAGMDLLKHDLAAWLSSEIDGAAVYERSEGHARKIEGLKPARGFLIGDCELPVEIEVSGLRYRVDPSADQKTGYYLDQAPQRRVLSQIAKGKRILDICAYSGGFTLPALQAGAASVTAIDASERALTLLRENAAANGLADERLETKHMDMNQFIKQPCEVPFDLVILDPPALAKAVRAAESAQKSYRQLNRDVAKWVKQGGLLWTFSCTGVVAREAFRRSVFLGLRDVKREARILTQFGPGPDHPVDLCFPEGEYLKGLALAL